MNIFIHFIFMSAWLGLACFAWFLGKKINSLFFFGPGQLVSIQDKIGHGLSLRPDDKTKRKVFEIFSKKLKILKRFFFLVSDQKKTKNTRLPISTGW
uniref:Uncharacterized protein n=1 Tax=viral metagenome TaxID=1070528 RepID=A0A6C0K4N3_9ZZZZ